MTALIRRLPRSNTPRPNESLSGYLLNLAYRLRLAPKELAIRTGLKYGKNPGLLDLQYSVRLPDDERANLGIATGLTDQELRNLTVEGKFADAALHADLTVARTLHSNLWLNLGHTRYCPSCLADTDPVDPDHAVWRIEWLTPWAVACTKHQCVLLDTCPTCQQPTGTSGPRAFRSTIPNMHRPVTHPAACRTQRLDRPTGLCDQRLDHAHAPEASDELLRLQHDLNQALDGAGRLHQTLGVPVTGPERLRDLRLTSILLQLVPTPGSSDPAPLPPRVLTQPPADTTKAAALMQRAHHLLADPANETEVHRLSREALKDHMTVWKKAIATGAPSSVLDHALKDPRNGIVDPAKIRVYTSGSPQTLTPAAIPAYLDNDTYQRHFDSVPSRYERSIRRCVPIALIRLSTNLDTEDAGAYLGYDASITQAACARASDAFDHIGQNQLRQRIARIAAEHSSHPAHTDYGRLRAAFTPNWTIPTDLWNDFQHRLLDEKLARADTPWIRRRPAYDAWIWGHITHGDLHTAPMIRTTLNGRACTNGVAIVIGDLIRRTPPAHHHAVHDLAHAVRERIPV